MLAEIPFLIIGLCVVVSYVELARRAHTKQSFGAPSLHISNG